ncbi:MAG: bifunctional metallophosphatase/5'-nucleotidase [Synergistaceae bacterium]|nr:bifunctional metallophosphatase/5'-nucleotidase [Synergistaceae bacterium]
MKKFFTLLLLLTIICLPSSAATKLPDKDIIILYTNDVHCGVDDNLGYAGFEWCAEQARKQTPYVTLVDAGDFAQGGNIGAISHGRYIVEIMNAISYDIAVPGNHEFDYGWAQFENFAKNLKCGFISCNLINLRTGKLVFKPYRILSYGDVKVAFVGACTPESITKSTPSYFQDDTGEYIYDFDGEPKGTKIIASIQKAVDDARAEGADYVILVGHLGEYKNVTTPEWTVPYIAPRTKGIDVFIDGHSHEVTPCLKFKNADSKDVLVTQSGTKLNNVGKVTIAADGKITTELLNNFDGRDERIEKVVEDIKERFMGTLKEHLGTTSFDLLAMDDKGGWLLRNKDTNLSNIVADAILASTKTTKTLRADIGMINAGGIRTNIKAGEITFKDVLSVLPFSNTVCICDIPGQTILDELEMGAHVMPQGNGGLIHASGLTYTVDTRIPTPAIMDEHNMLKEISGDRRIKDVMINGEPLDPEKTYRVAAVSYFIYMRGDGHVFKGAKLVEPDYMTVDQAFAKYVKELGVIPERYRNAQGRVKVIE